MPRALRALIPILLITSPATAGKIVVDNDEWTLSNRGFFDPINDPGIFANNVADWFTGGGTGVFHAYSTNFGLTEPRLALALTGGGHVFTAHPTVPYTFDLPTLQTFDGIFLAGAAPAHPGYIQILVDYVESGGNVYLAAGTGVGGPVAEAARWNPFLNHFGLGLTFPYNGVQGDVFIASTHPIFENVDHLYQNNGSSVLDLRPLDPSNQVLVSASGLGLYSIYAPVSPPPEVAEPPTALLLGIGLAVLAFCWVGPGRFTGRLRRPVP